MYAILNVCMHAKILLGSTHIIRDTRKNDKTRELDVIDDVSPSFLVVMYV